MLAPGTATQVASPVSQSETVTPDAAATAATVSACAHRSRASDPAVAFTTRLRSLMRAP